MSEATDIRRAIPADREILLGIWLRSVRATHTFLLEEDIQSMIPEVRDYLASNEPGFWVVCDDAGVIMGFMEISGSRMESLFLAPEFQRRGGGRRLVRHAQALHGELTVDVNEQNPAARGFYKGCGFVVEGRSELDDQGRSYPLLHMRLAAPGRPVQETGMRVPGGSTVGVGRPGAAVPTVANAVGGGEQAAAADGRDMTANPRARAGLQVLAILHGTATRMRTLCRAPMF